MQGAKREQNSRLYEIVHYTAVIVTKHIVFNAAPASVGMVVCTYTRGHAPYIYHHNGQPTRDSRNACPLYRQTWRTRKRDFQVARTRATAGLAASIQRLHLSPRVPGLSAAPPHDAHQHSANVGAPALCERAPALSQGDRGTACLCISTPYPPPRRHRHLP